MFSYVLLILAALIVYVQVRKNKPRYDKYALVVMLVLVGYALYSLWGLYQQGTLF